MLTYKEFIDATEKCYHDDDYSVEKEAEVIYDLLKQYDFVAEENVVQDLLGWEAVHEEALDRGRWSESMQTIINLNGHYINIYWHRGLTEYQDHWYEKEMCEVVKHTYEKTITVVEWINIEHI